MTLESSQAVPNGYIDVTKLRHRLLTAVDWRCEVTDSYRWTSYKLQFTLPKHKSNPQVSYKTFKLHTRSSSKGGCGVRLASSEFARVHLAIAKTCRVVTGEKLPEMDSRD